MAADNGPADGPAGATASVEAIRALVAAGVAERLVTDIRPLVVLKTRPPFYTATVHGAKVELTLAELRTFSRFCERCIADAQLWPALPA